MQLPGIVENCRPSAYDPQLPRQKSVVVFFLEYCINWKLQSFLSFFFHDSMVLPCFWHGASHSVLSMWEIQFGFWERIWRIRLGDKQEKNHRRGKVEGRGRVQRRKRKCTRKWNEKTCDETPLINQIIWEPLLPQQHFTNARTQRILVLNMVLIFLYSSYSYNFMIIPTWGNTCLPTLFIWF